jgi:release factor glutamine methyltransferase
VLAASPSPRLDAEVLVMHVTGLTRAQLITHGEQLLSAPQAQSLHELLARRARGEPVAYLTGQREFWSLPLHVTPDVLIPRPETELLVERALAHVPAGAARTLADLGTGSGAIALALAHERPRCRIIATDTSERALAVARANAARCKLTNVEFRQGEWLAALDHERVDLIVANPPYVALADPHLSEGDVRFEPRAALASGPDGLDAIRLIAAQSPARLTTGGWLLLEHGFDQPAAVRSILAEHGFQDITLYRDLAGHARVTAGRQP